MFDLLSSQIRGEISRNPVNIDVANVNDLPPTDSRHAWRARRVECRHRPTNVGAPRLTCGIQGLR
jgi:hypothetical protein